MKHVRSHEFKQWRYQSLATIFFVNANGRIQMSAIVYRNPANVNGGISSSPIFIITNDVDQRKVTSRASRIEVR